MFSSSYIDIGGKEGIKLASKASGRSVTVESFSH